MGNLLKVFFFQSFPFSLKDNRGEMFYMPNFLKPVSVSVSLILKCSQKNASLATGLPSSVCVLCCASVMAVSFIKLALLALYGHYRCTAQHNTQTEVGIPVVSSSRKDPHLKFATPTT